VLLEELAMLELDGRIPVKSDVMLQLREDNWGALDGRLQ